MQSDRRQRTACLWSYAVATVVLVWLTWRFIRSDLDFLLGKEKNWSSPSRAGNLLLSHSMTENTNDPLKYIADPFTHRVLKRDAGSRDFRSACFDFSGNSSKQVKCTPSFSVAGMPKSMPKSGTSALYFYLKHHPQLALMRKEVCALNSPPNSIFA